MDPIDNIENYRYGIFYYNKNDIRTVVAKKTRFFGWTLNFAIWKSYAFMGLFLVVIVAGVIFF